MRHSGHGSWGAARTPAAGAIWDEELEAAGAHFVELPATDNRECCDNGAKVTDLLEQSGFGTTRAWSESIEHRWRPNDYFEYQMRSTSRLRLLSLDQDDREACLGRIRKRLSVTDDEHYMCSAEVVMAIAAKRMLQAALSDSMKADIAQALLKRPGTPRLGGEEGSPDGKHAALRDPEVREVSLLVE